MSRTTPNLSKRNAQTPHSQQHLTVKLARYVGYFAIGYVLANTLFMMIQTKFALNSQLVTALSLFLGAYIAVNKFVKHQQRALNRSEINRLMFGSILVVWLLTAIYFLALWVWLFDDANRAVLVEMTLQQPLPLLSALVMILLLTLVSARISIWAVNRLLDPQRKMS